MEALTASASKLLLDKYGEKCFFSSKESYINRPQIMFLPSKKLVNGRFLELISMPHKAVQPIFSLPADAEADLESAAQNHIYKTNTVHVKFQLQKECQFGEQFLIVGDDPMFGLWDPKNAIPLDWSDEHLWSVELDIPVGKSIQFKFILKGVTGEILWQPGPDRIFQTWETQNTVTICEDWDDAECQKILEEDPTAIRNGKPTMKSQTEFPDSFTMAAEELVFNASNISDAVDSDINLAKIQRKPMEISAVNKNMMTEEDILGQNGRAATVNNRASTHGGGNLITYEGDPVLVPGSIPLPTVPTDRDIQEESQPSVAVGDASLGVDEAKNHNLPELDEKQEPENDSHQVKETRLLNDEEQELADELKEMPKSATEEVQSNADQSESDILENDQLDEKQESESDSHQVKITGSWNDEEQELAEELKEMPKSATEVVQSNADQSESDILENDMRWGRRTLHMFLNNLGLL